MKRIHLYIQGRVQGVFFRAHTQEVASRLALTGWVRNTSDGGVEVVAEGPSDAIKKLIEWCRKGPPAAHVTGVEQVKEPATGEFKEFRIRYG